MWNRPPVQVGCTRQVLGAGALGWPRGMGWGGRWEGFRMGNTCNSMADSCQCMAKLLEYCKVISLQLIKINGKKKGWVLKNWCLQTVVLEKTFENPLGCKEIQPVKPKGNHPWIVTGRTDTEAETLILWPPHVMNGLTGKDSDAGKDWGQEEKESKEDETVGWHHQLVGHEFEQTLGDGERQGSLVFCSSWGCRVRQLSNWTTASVKKVFSNLRSC